jgi:pre-mRNA-processing factor SLU7
MAHVSKTAVSRLLAQGDSDEPKTRSRDDFKKQKELEEARKLAIAPAAVDEEGKDINPHIPQYISDAPWYLDPTGPTLRHQRQQDDKVKKYSSITDWYKKGLDTSNVATKYRKGACQNCGAMGHQKRDCMDRPRKIGAKFSGSNFAPDEFQQDKLDLTFDGKRDRWNGYNPESHREVIEEFQRVDEVKKELKREKLSKGIGNKEDEDDDGAPSSDEDEDKYVDSMDMPGTKVDAAERYTVRNLRIREDTAKYLRNLNPNSAYYDPKTRAMRKNPYEETGRTEEEVDYAGDNFARISGDTVDHAKSQLFAWEAGSKGLDVHALAEPTKLEALRKQYTTKKDEFKDQLKGSILEKYGGLEHLNAPPKELIFAQTEDYVEYSRHGKVVRGQETPVVRSRYEEDVYFNNHTSVWGSYWKEGRWGYHCCHSMVKNSYCTGAAGKEANQNLLTLPPASHSAPEEEAKDKAQSEEEEVQKSEKKRKKKKRKKDKKKKRKRQSSSSSSSSSDEEDFEAKVAEAMKKQAAEEAAAERALAMDERKRPYNSMAIDNKTLSEAEMEAYHRKRMRPEDPMAQFMSGNK